MDVGPKRDLVGEYAASLKQHIIFTTLRLVFTALHCMQRGPSDRKSVCPSVCLSVRLSVTA